MVELPKTQTRHRMPERCGTQLNRKLTTPENAAGALRARRIVADEAHIEKEKAHRAL
jgi:hypothetical protein